MGCYEKYKKQLLRKKGGKFKLDIRRALYYGDFLAIVSKISINLSVVHLIRLKFGQFGKLPTGMHGTLFVYLVYENL